jgi:methyltransferase (TIGR00027 family)
MKADRGSVTALATSLMRAVHTRRDTPLIVEDAFGDRLLIDAERAFLFERLLLTLSPETQEAIRGIPDRAVALDRVVRDNPAYTAVLVRSRYAEDQLTAALDRGVRQYVLIGAGMDTLALRRPELAQRLAVFEIDHPATQALKRERFAAAGIDLPANLQFVAADLESESVAQALARSRYTAAEPACFAALGVTQFLTRDANLRMLRTIAGCAAPASTVVFDYLDKDAFAPDRTSAELKRLATQVANADEPWVSGFDPRLLAADLAGVGLALVEHLHTEDAQARYCGGRADGLRVTPHFHLVHARVAP